MPNMDEVQQPEICERCKKRIDPETPIQIGEPFICDICSDEKVNMNEVVREREEALKALAAATPGRWYWEGWTKDNSVSLITTKFGHRTVMDFVRWGMVGASPRFYTEENGMNRLDEPEMVTYRQEHRKSHFIAINHPDAHLIANAPEWLRNSLERERLLIEEREQDKAEIAKWKEKEFKACSLHHEYHDEIEKLESKVAEQDKEIQQYKTKLDDVVITLESIRDQAYLSRKCTKCNGLGYHHGFGEGGHDPDHCTACGGCGEEWDTAETMSEQAITIIQSSNL